MVKPRHGKVLRLGEGHAARVIHHFVCFLRGASVGRSTRSAAGLMARLTVSCWECRSRSRQPAPMTGAVSFSLDHGLASASTRTRLEGRRKILTSRAPRSCFCFRVALPAGRFLRPLLCLLCLLSLPLFVGFRDLGGKVWHTNPTKNPHYH